MKIKSIVKTTIASVLFFSLFVTLPSCKKDIDGSDFISFDIEGVATKVKILSDRKIILVAVPPQSSLSDLTAIFSLSPGAEAYINGYLQVSGMRKNDYSKRVAYAVIARNGTVSIWNVYVKDYEFEDLSSIGLGTFVGKRKSLDVDYDWYIVQTNFTCGPACVAMASRWSDMRFTKTGLAIQNEIKPDGGGTRPNDLFQYFLKHDIPVRIDIFSTSSMQEYIEFNTIAVIILDMNLIRYCENVDFKTDRFYGTNNTSSPHFIVVKGYIEVDEELFFEVYDGASGARYFQDGSYKGKNRYYRGNDLVKAVGACKWGMKAMVISKK